MVKKKEDVVTLSEIDSEILELIRRIVAFVDNDTRHYLYKILAEYKVSRSDIDIKLRLEELLESINNKPLTQDEDEDSEELKIVMIKIGDEWVDIKGLRRFKADKHYDYKNTVTLYDIILGRGHIISYLSEEKRDKDLEKIKINLEMFDNHVFLK